MGARCVGKIAILAELSEQQRLGASARRCVTMRILLVIMVCLLAALTVSLKIPIAKLDSKISNAMVGEVQAKKFPYTPYDLTPEDPGNDQLFYLVHTIHTIHTIYIL